MVFECIGLADGLLHPSPCGRGWIASLQRKLARRELVAEGATRRAPHDCLSAFEADFAFADRRDVGIGLANQQRTEFGLAEFPKKLSEAAARHVDVQRLLVMAQNFDLDLFARDLAEDALDGRPFAPRAALDAIANGGKQLLRPIAQGLLYDGVSLVLAKFGSQCTKHRHQDLGLHARLVQQGYLGVYKIVVDDAAHSAPPNERRKSRAFVIARMRRGDSVAAAANLAPCGRRNPRWQCALLRVERSCQTARVMYVTVVRADIR